MVTRNHLLISAVVLAIAATATAQQVGSIQGVVQDGESKRYLAGAKITVVESGQRARTDAAGLFTLKDMPVGAYTLIISKKGYLQVIRKVSVTARQVVNERVEMLGDWRDLEEFVVRRQVVTSTASEQQSLDSRLNSAAMINAISSEEIGKTGASDAAGAFRLIAGASTQDGKSAVIRGLPDRYVSTQVNGALMPSSDEDKRAVELDFVPANAIEAIQVSKTFTPDQQGNASGGAVNIRLRSVPDEPFFFNYKLGSGYNSQVTGRNRFLTYDDGGVHGFGRSGSERNIQAEGENWEGAVGAGRGLQAARGGGL